MYDDIVYYIAQNRTPFAFSTVFVDYIFNHEIGALVWRAVCREFKCHLRKSASVAWQCRYNNIPLEDLSELVVWKAVYSSLGYNYMAITTITRTEVR